MDGKSDSTLLTQEQKDMLGYDGELTCEALALIDLYVKNGTEHHNSVHPQPYPPRNISRA